MTSTYQQLISAVQLSQIINNKNVVLLDASIPPVGAMSLPDKRWPTDIICSENNRAKFFDIENHFSDHNNPLPHTFPSAEQFQQQARNLGIDADSQIVVYDCYGIFSSARAWWMFKAMGHNNVAVLNGGLPAWNAQIPSPKTSVSMNEFPNKVRNKAANKVGNFVANFNCEFIANSNTVLEALSRSECTVLDARAEARFLGRVPEPRQGVRSGHMPGAINLPYTQLLLNGEMLPKTELVDIFKEKTSMEKALYLSCGSGVTACVLALAADIIGFKLIKVYDGSWSEWGSTEALPVVTE